MPASALSGIRLSSGKLVLFLVVVALVLRVLYLLTVPDKLVFGDAMDYWTCSENIVKGNGFSLQPGGMRLAHVPPLYPLQLAALKASGVTSLVGIRLAQILLAVSILPLVYWLGVGFFPRNVMAGTVALYAVSPHMIHWTTQIATENLAIILFALSLFALLRTLGKASPLLQVLSIALLGLAVLARAVFMFLPPVFLLGFVGRGRRWAWRAVGCLGLFALILFPWTLRNYLLFDHIVPVTLGAGRAQVFRLLQFSDEYLDVLNPKQAFFEHHHATYLQPPTPLDEYESDAALQELAREMRRAHPVTTLKLYLYNFARFWSPGATFFAKPIRWSMFLPSFFFGGLLFPFALIGLRDLFRRDRIAFAIIVLILAYFTAVHTLLIGMIRYRMPLDPILYLLASLGVADLWRRFRSRGDEAGGVLRTGS